MCVCISITATVVQAFQDISTVKSTAFSFSPQIAVHLQSRQQDRESPYLVNKVKCDQMRRSLDPSSALGYHSSHKYVRNYCSASEAFGGGVEQEKNEKSLA